MGIHTHTTWDSPVKKDSKSRWGIDVNSKVNTINSGTEAGGTVDIVVASLAWETQGNSRTEENLLKWSREFRVMLLNGKKFEWLKSSQKII